MDDRPAEAEPAYHLLLSDAEVPLTASALWLLISDEAHQPQIRCLARVVLAELDAAGPRAGEHTHSVAPQSSR